MRSWTSYQTLSQIQLKFQLLNYDDEQWVESIIKEQRWFEPIKTQLGILDHMTYVGPWPTYTNLPSDPLKQEWVHATQEHSTPPIQLIATWVHATLAISPLLVRE